MDRDRRHRAPTRSDRRAVDPQLRDAARAQLRDALVAAACDGRTVTYGELAAAVTAMRVTARGAALMRLLGEVCAEEDARTGADIAALVVRRDTGMPGEGYFGSVKQDDDGVPARVSRWRDACEHVWNAYRDG